MRDTPEQKIDAMLQALETLSEQHEMLLKDGLLKEAAEVRERLAAVTAEVPPLMRLIKARGGLSKAQQARADRIQDNQRRCIALLQSQSRQAQVSMDEVAKARTRLLTMKKSYGKSPYAARGSKQGGAFEVRG